ncbi:hypothetical protein J6590_031912 [Homalodisca vitripennis]|nr:hypothetical protein J6590_031912 [Homalodisca vitripennis]
MNSCDISCKQPTAADGGGYHLINSLRTNNQSPNYLVSTSRRLAIQERISEDFLIKMFKTFRTKWTWMGCGTKMKISFQKIIDLTYAYDSRSSDKGPTTHLELVDTVEQM